MFAVIFSGICMLSARTSTTVAIAALILFPFFISGKSTFTVNLFPYLFIILFIPAVFFGYLHFYNRFQQVENEIVIRQQEPEVVQKEEPNSTNIRINIWSNAVQLISRNLFFGVGTGDIKEELVKVYTENHYEYGIRERISPHNQFLHTGVILGIIGVAILLLQLVVPAWLAFKYREWLYFFFLAVIFLNCLTESMLEREAGILFFTAFNSCFYLRLRAKINSLS
jgi:O-antigen ligase